MRTAAFAANLTLSLNDVNKLKSFCFVDFFTQKNLKSDGA
jgi:hypothetical protein